mmetsp:Transcript_59806/g.142401  ORF Transcript_59806/g.142401 Transcript_59806/m.142401 type:complete len:576 (+) Transcript_59806:86-1813(+)
MGAAATTPQGYDVVPKMILEVSIARPAVPRPRGPDGQLLDLFAIVRVMGEGSDYIAEWGQPVSVPIASADAPRIKVQMLAAMSAESISQGQAFHVSEICIPYSGLGGLQELGLREDGPQVDMRVALVHGARVEDLNPAEQAKNFVRALRGVPPDAPQVAITIKEIAVELPAVPAQATAPNAEAAAVSSSASAEGRAPLPSPRRSLDDVLRENDELQRKCESVRRQVERMKASATKAARAAQGLEASREVEELQQELAQAQEQQLQIRQTFEERTRDLQEQIRQVKEEGPAGSGALEDARVVEKQQMLEDEVARRDQLMRQWREAVAEKQDRNAPSNDPEIQELNAKSRQYEAELAALQQELAIQAEREMRLAAKNSMGEEARTLREQLDDLQQMTEDERVRSEYEVRELKKDRDVAKDRQEEAFRERQCSLARKEALEGYQNGQGATHHELDQLREEHQRYCDELERLQKLGEARKEEIALLEVEQMKQIEEANSALLRPQANISSAASLRSYDEPDDPERVLALEDEVAALEALLTTTQDTCQVLEAETSRLRREIATIQACRTPPASTSASVQ